MFPPTGDKHKGTAKYDIALFLNPNPILVRLWRCTNYLLIILVVFTMVFTDELFCNEN